MAKAELPQPALSRRRIGAALLALSGDILFNHIKAVNDTHTRINSAIGGAAIGAIAGGSVALTEHEAMSNRRELLKTIRNDGIKVGVFAAGSAAMSTLLYEGTHIGVPEEPHQTGE